MGRPERGDRCRRHPNHKESKGVCPSCLRERLSHLSASSSSSTANASSTTTSPSPSSSHSAAASPPHRDPGSGRLGGGAKPLTKSRSLAFVLRRDRKEEEKEKDKGRKKRIERLWSKLVAVGSGRSGEEGGGLPHSKTMKERSSTKWGLF